MKYVNLSHSHCFIPFSVESTGVFGPHTFYLVLYTVAMWLLRIYAFRKLTIALGTAHSAISTGQECYTNWPRMLYQLAKSAISEVTFALSL